jgi:hypothetical protein
MQTGTAPTEWASAASMCGAWRPADTALSFRARPEQALSYLGLSLATTTVALLGLLQYTVIVVDRHLSTLL